MRPMRRACTIATVVAVAGCTSPTGGRAPSPDEATVSVRPLGWHTVSLPEGLSAVTLTSQGDDVLVGAIGSGRPRPHLLVGSTPDHLVEVPVSPASPYGFEARWFQVATHGTSVVAVGGARGGAHGNHRWSTWSGDASAVVEQEQPFGVFGSYGAGDLVGVAYAGRSPVILGAWQSARTGQDIATWVRTGTRWERRSSAGTALESTPGELVSATSITPRGTGLLLTGSVTRLDDGAVHVTPAVWVTGSATGGWLRLDLPRTGTEGTSEVHAGTCTGEECLLTGVTDGRLDVWRTGGLDRLTGLAGIPAVRVPENARALAPVGPPGSELVVTPSGSESAVLAGRGDEWEVSRGPSGRPTAAVLHDGELWVITLDAEGAGTLWTARVA